MALESSGAAALLDGGMGDDGAAAAAAAAAGGGDQGAGGDQPGGAQGGAVDPEWYANLADAPGEGETASNRDYVKAKGVKDLDGLVRSYRAAEKGLHESGRLKVPGDDASPEDRAAFNKAIGVPDDPSGYAVTLPETNGGLSLNADLIGSLADIAHKSGVPKAGFEAIANAYVESQVAQHLEMVQKEDAGREAVLKEWGAAKAQHIAEANSAMRALGLTQGDVAAMQAALSTPEQAGSARVLKLLQKIGGGMAEDVLLTGGTGRFGITPAEAQVRINAIKADPEKARAVRVKDSAEQREWNSLLATIGAAKDAAERER